MTIPSAAELLKLQEDLQEDSDWVLNKIDLLPKLRKYGDVQVVGAKALGIMIARDIDISVIVPELESEDWAELVKNLLLTPHIRRVTAIDYYHYDTEHLFNPE